MGKLILMRHGESVWNKKNVFTGWVDVPLSPNGIEEALRAGEKIKHIPFDGVFVSTLCRAQMTAHLALSVHDEGLTPVLLHEEDKELAEWGKIYSEKTAKQVLPMIASSKLNERMYGELQGCDKDETREKFGKEQVHIWRRSYDVAPPGGESLEMTANRTIPYFENRILPLLMQKKNILVSAHGNSLRALCMYLEKLSSEEVVKLEIPTGEPICYTFSENRWKKETL